MPLEHLHPIRLLDGRISKLYVIVFLDYFGQRRLVGSRLDLLPVHLREKGMLPELVQRYP